MAKTWPERPRERDQKTKPFGMTLSIPGPLAVYSQSCDWVNNDSTCRTATSTTYKVGDAER